LLRFVHFRQYQNNLGYILTYIELETRSYKSCSLGKMRRSVGRSPRCRGPTGIWGRSPSHRML